MSSYGRADHQVPSAAAQVSISEVAKLMKAELNRLLERRHQIMRRTRDLKSVLLGLKSGVGGPSVVDANTGGQLCATPRGRRKLGAGDCTTSCSGESPG
jgi:hypothetical protein